MTNKLKIQTEFLEICKMIQDENLDLRNWSLIESSDQFQTINYCGGFDATEEEFCFSYYDENRIEYWFQFPLSDVDKITNGTIKEIEIRKAE
jgi:hypothetical protein